MRVLEWPGKRGKAILGEPRVESRETNILSRLRSIPWPFLMEIYHGSSIRWMD